MGAGPSEGPEPGGAEPPGQRPPTLAVKPLSPILDALEAELRDRAATWTGGSDPFEEDDVFNDWALRIHEAQCQAYPALARFWEGRGSPRPGHWTEIPPVPAQAFKSTPLGPDGPEAVFRTSGTTRGGEKRGEHRIGRLSLYRAAARLSYRAALLPGGASVRLLSLVPHPEEDPHSSLARMVGFIALEDEVEEAVWYFRSTAGVLVEECRAWLAEACEDRTPVLILSTAFALAQLLEAMATRPVGLPAGSSLMETGGFKGHAVALGRDELYDRVWRTLDIGEPYIVGEYGMTELLSQAYDGQAGSAGPVGERRHHFPPWVRTRVLDPVSLEPADPGTRGVLAHFDLANAASVSHVLTEDLGVLEDGGGFRLLGRAEGSEMRGCSLMAESFIRSLEGRR